MLRGLLGARLCSECSQVLRLEIFCWSVFWARTFSLQETVRPRRTRNRFELRSSWCLLRRHIDIGIFERDGRGLSCSLRESLPTTARDLKCSGQGRFQLCRPLAVLAGPRRRCVALCVTGSSNLAGLRWCFVYGANPKAWHAA